MSLAKAFTNRRVLVIDDNEQIHHDFRKILTGLARQAGLDELEVALFGDNAAAEPARDFQVDSALQGREGLERVQQALASEQPYAMAFVDMRMPPGWDGAETISRIWEVDPEVQVVLCTAYSDYSWDDFLRRFGQSDRLLILKKPFDNVEAYQLACTLTEKWTLARCAALQMDQLEHEVARRTSEAVAEREKCEAMLVELRQTQAQLLQADKLASIGQLAAGVAHEINNPIGYMSSNLNTLKEYFADIKQFVRAYERCCGSDAVSATTAKKHADLTEIRARFRFDQLAADLDDLISESIEGARRVRKIVADLRDFSHVDNPDLDIEDINRLLDKTVNVAWNELKYKAELVREYGELPQVRCYGGKLGQVFLNLLVNAVHAIATRGTVTIRTGAAQTEQVWIEIEDTGCGIPEQNLKRIFDPFFTTKDVGNGTGLGLYLVYNIITAHRGKIEVRSTVGQGTVFRIELPVAGPPEAKEQAHDCAA